MIEREGELQRRLALWQELRNLTDINPGLLREKQVYGGAQGIWVDKSRTGPLSADGRGVTVTVLHTGHHYPDDLSDDGVVYHYPSTGRPEGRDAAEVQATKNAAEAKLPIFVILPGERRASTRSVRLGWITDWDDEAKQFLILFGESRPDYRPAEAPDAPFQLTDTSERKRALTNVRPGQQRFRFQVIAKYGCYCAVCGISHPVLVKAAHLRGKSERGSDDWRNGVPLCATHHDAFDAHLFSINPETMQIVTAPEVLASSIGINQTAVGLLRNRPHQEALRWRWHYAIGKWGIDKSPVVADLTHANAETVSSEVVS